MMRTAAVLALTLTLSLAHAAGQAIVVVRGTNETGPEAAAVRSFTDAMGTMLQRAGLQFEGQTDKDVEQGRLEGAKLAIFPYNPAISAAEAKAVVSFLGSGGKVLLFYSAPANVLEALGLKSGGRVAGENARQRFATCRLVPGVAANLPASFRQESWNINAAQPARADAKVLYEWVSSTGEAVGQPALLLSDSGAYLTHVLTDLDKDTKTALVMGLVGHFLPEVWVQAAQRSRDNALAFGRTKTLEELSARVAQAPLAARAAARRELDETSRLLQEAAALQEQRQYAEALKLLAAARGSAAAAYTLAEPTIRSEARAAWIHTAFGVKNWGWEKSIRHLKEMGFNMVLPNMLWGGVAYYDSKVLPVSKRLEGKGDQIAECLKWCRKYGVQLHVWKVNFNLGHDLDPAYVEKLRGEHRLARTIAGEEKTWLCASNPANQQQEIAAMVEVATKYDVDGIHFDYIRYNGSEVCFCDGCRERFEKRLGHSVEGWPQAVTKPPLRDEWNQFRRDNITAVVAGVSEQVKRLRPKCQISAAVFGDFKGSRESIAQDTKLWVDRGYLDFVCPMDYLTSDAAYESTIRRQVEAVGGRLPLYIGIGEWQLPGGLGQTTDQIALSRRLGADGFVIFHYDDLGFTDKRMPQLRRGPLSADAVRPHEAPRLRYRLPEAPEGFPAASYAEGQELVCSVRLQPGRYTRAALQARRYDGTVAAELGSLTGAVAQDVTVKLPAGDYRLAVEGTRADTNTYFLSRGPVFHVLTAAQVEDLQARRNPPVFRGEGLKVGVLLRGYGSEAILKELQGAPGVNALPLQQVTAEHLAPCQVVVLPQRRSGDLLTVAQVEALRAWVRQGGGLLVTHDAVGVREQAAVVPEVAEGVEVVSGATWRAARMSQLDGQKVYTHTFYDRVTLKPAGEALIWAVTAEGQQPLVVGGGFGRGRYVANGMALCVGTGDVDVPASEGERELLLQAVRWLGKQ